ncbi:hypothetical protein ABIE24_002752 [Mycetocola sp. 2940]
MNRIRMRTGMATTVTALTATMILAMSSVAHADTLQDTIADTGAGVTLTAGSATTGSASIRVVGNNAAGDPDPGCNIDVGESPLVLDIRVPAGITANPDPLTITSCGDNFSVTFSASSAAVSGNATVVVLSGPAGGGTYVNQVNIPITVTQPVPTNTPPSVVVTGVSDGATYEIGNVPVAGCAVADAEDATTSVPAVISGTLSHGLGTQTATCDYTDAGGLSAITATASYVIADTGNPTIDYLLSPSTPNVNGWYDTDVTVSFNCADAGSGIQSCTDGTTLGEGANQSVTGTATDWAGNTATAAASGLNIDKTDPTVGFSGGPASSYYFGNDVAAPTCVASDTLSGVASCTVTGGGTAVGSHSYIAVATDNAGNSASATLGYTVLAWTVKGFYSPVDMGGVWNTVKGGSTVPLKFEIFAGSELTSTTAIKSFSATSVTCPGATAATDEIELVTTGGTSLRYDATAGQFIQNWATPKKPGTCAVVTMTALDGSKISANFILK